MPQPSFYYTDPGEVYAASSILPSQLPQEGPGWFSAVGDAIALQPFWQMMAATQEWMMPDEPGFNPVARENLVGYEQYGDQFIGVRSRAQSDALKARLDENLRRRAAVEEELGLGGMLAAELFNPINYIPLPGLASRGVVKGVLKGAASVGALSVAEEGLRLGVDPTSTLEESSAQAFYGSIFGGLLGGAAGALGSREAVRLGQDYHGKWNAVEREIVTGMPVADDMEPIIPGLGQFQARPTGDVAIGVAPAYGFEKQTNITPYGRLKNSGVRAVEDFVDAIAGTFDVLSARNRQQLPTQASAYLAAGRWRGKAASVVQEMQQAYARYRFGGEGGAELMDFNVPVGVQRIKEYVGKGATPDGKLTYEQFKEAVFRAHVTDQLDGLPPEIADGVKTVRQFFEDARKEGIKSGSIRSADHFKKLLSGNAERARVNLARMDELLAKPSRTANESAELVELAKMQERLLEWFEKRIDVEDDETLKEIIARYDAQLAKQRDPEAVLAEINAGATKRRDEAIDLRAAIERSMELRRARDQEILDHLNRLYVERGLSDKQIAYRDMLEARLFDEPGSPRQQATMDKLNAQLSPADIEAMLAGQQELDALAPFDRAAAYSVGDVVYHGVPVDPARLGNFIDADGNLVLQPINDLMDLPGAPPPRGTVGEHGAHVFFGTDRSISEQFAAGQWANRKGERVRGVVFEIDRDALPDLFFDPAASYEVRTNAAGKVVVPPGKWKATDAVTGAVLDIDPKGNIRNFMSERTRRYVDALEQKLAKEADSFQAPANEPSYITRFWQLDEVLADQQLENPRLNQILFDWFKENPLPGAKTDDASIQRRVEEAIKSILKEADGQQAVDYEGPGASFLLGRKLDIPNRLVADFIETDPEKITRTYAMRFGLINEYSRMFGEADAASAIDDVVLQAARELNMVDAADGARQLAALRRDMTELRDAVTGAIYSTDPAMMNKRRNLGFLRNLSTISSLGTSAMSSIPEAGRIMMVEGFGRTLRFALEGILGNPAASRQVSSEMAALTGEGVDVVLATGMQRFVEQGGPTGPTATKLGRLMNRTAEFTNGPYFLLNGLSFVTDITKKLNLTFINQFMMEDALKVAGGTASKREIEKLASYGLSIEDAQKIAQMPFDRSGRVILPNVAEWPDEDLAMRYLGAVTGMSQRVVPTASPANMPMIARGFIKGREFPLLTLPFQFMNYGLAAMNKVMLSSLQGRDANPIGGVAALIGLAWMAQSLRPGNNWDNLDFTEKMYRAVDGSGVLGIYNDIPGRVERASMGQLSFKGAIGLDPMVRKPDWTTPLDAVGPVPGKIADLTDLAIDGDMTNPERTRVIRRTLPLNDLLWWRSAIDELERTVPE